MSDDSANFESEKARAVAILREIFGDRLDMAIKGLLVEADVIHESMRRAQLAAVKKDNPQ